MTAEPDLDIDVAGFALGSARFADAIRIDTTVFHQEWELSRRLFEEQGRRPDFHGCVALVSGTAVGDGLWGACRARPLVV